MTDRPPSVEALRPNDFGWYGFDHRQDRVERHIRRAAIRRGSPRASVIAGGIVVPGLDRPHEDRPADYGGVVTADGRPVPAALLRRTTEVVGGLVAPVAVKPARELDEDVVFLGWLFEHFGHVLLESLARIWFLHEIAPSVRAVFLPYPAAHPSPAGTVRRILDAFGLPVDRILTPEVPTRFRRVTVPEPLYELNVAAHERFVWPFREVAARIVGDAVPSPRPVYLSRRRLPSRNRPLVGEGELEEVLRERGFVIAYPETMTFEEQVRLVNGHTDIVSSAGSAAHNVLFALNRPRLHLLTGGDDFGLTYALCSMLAGARTTFVHCLDTAGRPFIAPAPRRTPLRIEAPKLTAYLDERGFVPDQRRSNPTPRAAVPDPDHDPYGEAWLGAWVRIAIMRQIALPPTVEREALDRAAASWPLSALLASYYAHTDGANSADLVARFLDRVEAETDAHRLEQFRADIRVMLRRVARVCADEVFDRLSAVATDRFDIDPATVVRQRNRAVAARCSPRDEHLFGKGERTMGKRVALHAGERHLEGYLAAAATGRGSGVLVLHSWWGLTDHFKRVCDRFAAEGFTALAPDLYHGPRTDDPDEAERLLDALDRERAKADISAALDFLRAQPATGDDGLGVVGFSMGGSLAMEVAPLRPEVRAVVLFYGLELPDFASLRAAVQGHFVENDYPPGQDHHELERRLLAAGKAVEIYVYPGAEHAFFNPTRPEAYDEAAARLAWTRLLDFLRHHLGLA